MKRRFYSGIVRYRRAIMVLFAVITAVSAFMIPRVEVNYDLVDYLPRDYMSTRSLRLMHDEFGDMPNTKVVLRDVSVKDIERYRSELEAIDGVTAV